ncbi:MAG: hypothetical protein HQL36_09260 [Alphaproteobacteria bacterium]|nr:hypothetical protein [Alphaproteobacteria bacterium]
MDRRGLLSAAANPDKQLDYLVTLTGHMTSAGAGRHAVEVRYVPDKFVLEARSLGAYLDALASMTWENPEELAVTILTDLNNELVARWAQVRVNVPERHHHAVETHGVVIEDRQPGWDNPGLLGRLERL